MAQRIMNADVLTSHGNLAGRRAMVDILEAGLQAADPYNNVHQLMHLDGHRLVLDNPHYEPIDAPLSGPMIIDLNSVNQIYVFGAGKGIQRMAKGIEDVLGDHLTGGMVIEKHGVDVELERIGVTFGAHPLPDQGCLDGCRRILAMACDLTPRDLVFTVTGNGISSLLTLPVDAVSLEDLRSVTYKMQIERGVPTGELNPIRNHLDQMKGGKITRALRPAQIIHLLAWDCHGYDWLLGTNVWLHTLPDRSTFSDAVAMLHKWEAWDDMPASVRRHLGKAALTQETMKRPEFEAGRERIFGVMPERFGMLPTAAQRARELGFAAHILEAPVHAEASSYAAKSAERALSIAASRQPYAPPCALINGGEMVVTVGKETGIGGRNQEFALAAATHIAGSADIIIGSVDSDGNDGPSTQFAEDCEEIPCLAGGIVDGFTVQEAIERGVDLEEALRRHNSTPALCALDSGIAATANISLNDLTVVLTMEPKQSDRKEPERA